MITVSRSTVALTAAGLALTGIAVAPQLGAAANARATTHTLKLTAHQSGTHSLGKTTFAGTDVDRNPTTGAIVGYDAIRGRFNVSTGVVKIDAAVALKGGMITAHLTGHGNSTTLDGTITGGTGKYSGVTGTIHTTQKSGSSKVTHITLTYTL
ncbi:hypothetical protein [Nocardioides cynanchi]|uniref:hypothetical protein n=1 Tax=Nocardioides cynanchi TaxID=2558918 RepID=UPI0012472706|nr:hypothetical protein [Nocardioides cynanchi]